jgi:hypothetical protein
MLLTKDELMKALKNEVEVFLHLASKVDPKDLEYRPTPKQRSLLELLQYMAIMGPIHLRAIRWPAFDMEEWRGEWTTGEQAAKSMNLEQTTDAIGKQSGLFTELVSSMSDADLRSELEMFGIRASRGSWIVNLVLCHYVAYRMQLFLYLKSCGREELNTLNLWVGRDSL